MYFRDNLKVLRKSKGMSQEEVAKKLNTTRSSYSGYENGVAEPGIKRLLEICEFYQIPVDDLLKRDLSKLDDKDLERISKGLYSDTKGEKLRILTSQVNKENEEVIEMIPEKARAGYTMGYSDPEYIKVLPTFNLPFLSKNKKYRSFPISGDSMPPVSEGSHVIGEFLQNWELIKNGAPYIVITKDEGIVFKLVSRIDSMPNFLQLSSTNPLYKPYEVNINDVIEIWKFVNYISPDLPEVDISANDLLKTVKGLQNEVHELKNAVKSTNR